MVAILRRGREREKHNGARVRRFSNEAKKKIVLWIAQLMIDSAAGFESADKEQGSKLKFLH